MASNDHILNSATTITLKTSDKKLIEVEKDVAFEMISVRDSLYKNAIDAGSSFRLKPMLVDVEASTLYIIIKYIKKCLELELNLTDVRVLREYDGKFVKNFGYLELKRLYKASIELNMKHLHYVITEAMADSYNAKGEIFVTKPFSWL